MYRGLYLFAKKYPTPQKEAALDNFFAAYARFSSGNKQPPNLYVDSGLTKDFLMTDADVFLGRHSMFTVWRNEPQGDVNMWGVVEKRIVGEKVEHNASHNIYDYTDKIETTKDEIARMVDIMSFWDALAVPIITGQKFDHFPHSRAWKRYFFMEREFKYLHFDKGTTYYDCKVSDDERYALEYEKKHYSYGSPDHKLTLLGPSGRVIVADTFRIKHPYDLYNNKAARVLWEKGICLPMRGAYLNRTLQQITINPQPVFA